MLINYIANNTKVMVVSLLFIVFCSKILAYGYDDPEYFDKEIIDYYREHQDDIINKIKNKEVISFIKPDIEALDKNIQMVNKARGAQLDKLHYNPINVGHETFVTTKDYGRRSKDEDVRPEIIEERERIFKVYVTNGTFGKYNKNKPIVLMGGSTIIDDKGRKFATDKQYILQPNSSERYIKVRFISGVLVDTIPAYTQFNVRSREELPYIYSNKNSIKFTNVKPILFMKIVYESDESYRKMLIHKFNRFRKYVLNTAIYNDGGRPPDSKDSLDQYLNEL